MDEWNYLYAGLRVTSEIELPEWNSFLFGEVFEQSDVFISLLKSEDDEFELSVPGPTVTKDEYTFFVPNIGRYGVFNGSKIVVSLLAGASKNEIRLFLLGSAWGALCYQRGLFAVHASAVKVGDGAVLFCAQQGRGKSTMTAWLTTRGYDLVSDDLCCIDVNDSGQYQVYPSTQRMRLWDDALESLGWSNKLLERDQFRINKFLLPLPTRASLKVLPIIGIYMLDWSDNSIKPLTGVNALQRFVADATYRGEVLQLMGMAGEYWQKCFELLKKVRIWDLSRQKDISQIDDVLNMVEQHWRDTGYLSSN